MFTAQRGRLLSVAYRITGSVADAEDAVQESWLRLERTDIGAIADLRAWLTTVVGRICLDRLRSAAVRRETYPGQWLPEPVVRPLSATAPADPLDVVVRDEDSRLAVLVVLERLTPDQRVAFVLHDGFGVPFGQIADTLGVSAAAARQAAARARRRVAGAAPSVSSAQHAAAVTALVDALSSGDLAAVVAALHPEATFAGDTGGTSPTAPNVIVGADRVARYLLGLAGRYGAQRLLALTPVAVNGRAGLWHPGAPADPVGGRPPIAARVIAVTVAQGRVIAGYDMANPARLTGVRLTGLPGPHR